MKKTFILIIIMSLLMLTGCKLTRTVDETEDENEQEIDERFMSSGDFLYQIVEINDKGIQIVEGSENKNCVDRFARIRGLSKEGKKKEILIIPKTIDGLEVKEIAAYIDFDSEVLRRLYIPFAINIWGYGIGERKNAPNLKKVIIMSHDIINNKNYLCYISSYSKTSDYEKKIGHTNQRYANVSYMYNYEEAPNYGYYWIDDYGRGDYISYVPTNPVRDGYIFDGWYKEPECINKWDFGIDTMPLKEKDEEGKWLYLETKLYAKWIEE